MIGEMAMDFGALPSELMRLDPTDLGICVVAWREVKLARAQRAIRLHAQPVSVV